MFDTTFENGIEIDPGSVTVSEYSDGSGATAALDYLRRRDSRRQRGSLLVTQVVGGRYVLQPTSWAFYDLAEPANPSPVEWLGRVFGIDGRLIVAGFLVLMTLAITFGTVLGRLLRREKLRYGKGDPANAWPLALGALHSVVLGLKLNNLTHK